MDYFLQQLQFSASITGPVCLMLLLGVFLKKVSAINDNFIEIASKLVFRVTLPALLFLSIVRSDHDYSGSMPLIIFGVSANIVFFVLVHFLSKKIFPGSKDQGVIIQGSSRANIAIVGLAYVSNVYGDTGLALAAIYVAPITFLYNVLAIIALTPAGPNRNSLAKTLGTLLRSITKNPLIIAICLGLIVYFAAIPIPEMVLHTGQYFANMTLPLALLCTGGSLDLRSLHHDRLSTWYTTFNKLVLSPILTTLVALVLGFRGMELGIIFLLSSTPTAAASYVMARAMGGNATLAANIIALTTVASLLSCTVGLMVMSGLSLL